jgi:hypothetical protein
MSSVGISIIALTVKLGALRADTYDTTAFRVTQEKSRSNVGRLIRTFNGSVSRLRMRCSHSPSIDRHRRM